ncbi:hypothetical protein TUM4261_33070 [Shewanella sp. c952]|uniref:hypothetical protein n=1 Tax=Shewanella sp. c952 TaxID=2815913 RepID=UPI001BBFE779|nr:hypothetical protein [Shewanella sp. c952]GIU15681.1 hypothetical protein TUM4261_33070 [Shewanella sp. c952]
MSVAKSIRASLRTGEVLTIIYNGGSQPGIVREIVPIQLLHGDEKVRARCMLSGVTKVFIVDKIALMDSDGVITEGHDFVPVKKYGCMEELYDATVLLLGEKPFHINKSSDAISVHKIWKNGNPHKGSLLSMSFFEFTSGECFFDELGNMTESEPKLSTRPWSISGGSYSNSYKYFDKAAHYFLEVLVKIVK